MNNNLTNDEKGTLVTAVVSICTIALTALLNHVIKSDTEDQG